MDGLSDDDIELLKQTPEEDQAETTISGSSQLDSNLNPLALSKRAKLSDDNSGPASVHALHTAFKSLQKQLNDEVKKSKELKKENIAIRKAFMDATQVNHKQFPNMEEYNTEDAQVVHAAGGTSEDDSFAENRAKVGYLKNLERNLLVTRNAVQTRNEEIATLKQLNQALEREVSKHLREKDELDLNLGIVAKELQESIRENERIKLENDKIGKALMSEQELNHKLKVENELFQEQNQRNSLPGQSEVQNLKTALASKDNELKKTRLQYMEVKKDKDIFEAKCKQYEIEANIRSENKQIEDMDDVDGDVARLVKALSILDEQRKEVSELKQKILSQQKIISQLQSTGKRLPGKSMESFRPEAQGSSFHPLVEGPVYENSGFMQQAQSSHSPISRRSSDRGDYRGRDNGQKTSPRVNDTIRTTGSVKPMLAMETNQQPKRMELAGAFDTSSAGNPNRTRSPGENFADSHYNHNVRSNVQENLSTRTSVAVNQNQSVNAQQSPRSSASPRTVDVSDQYGSRIIESARIGEASNMSSNQALYASSSQNSAFIQTGARPRVPSSNSHFNQFGNQEVTSPRQAQQYRIPDRMTQSEIIVRARPDGSNGMSESVHEQLQDIPKTGYVRQNEYVHAETSGMGQNLLLENTAEHIYQNEYGERFNGPDYENIYNANAQTETKRPIEEHEEPVFVTASPQDVHIVRPVQEETTEGNVSAVKICPVCNEEFSRLSLDQFQMHVFECFDNCDESPATLQPSAGGSANDDDRVCPMCGDVFPLTIPQETYEQHVLAHFGEDPMVERFEMLQ